MPLPTQRVEVYFVYGSDQRAPFVNVHHYFPEVNYTVSQGSTDGIAATIGALAVVAYQAVIPAEAKYLRTKVVAHDGGVTFEGEHIPAVLPGNVAGDQEPDYVSVVLRKKTAVGGRRGRGRFYIGCVPEANTDTNRLNNGSIASYVALAQFLAADQNVMGAGNLKAAHHSPADVTLVPITAITVISTLAVLRRRRLRQIV